VVPERRQEGAGPGRGLSGLGRVLKYKKSFAPGGEVPFRVGTKIHELLLTERLVEERRRWEKAGQVRALH
jgi:hypothetical protein